jgi:hypothetical protein
MLLLRPAANRMSPVRKIAERLAESQAKKLAV